MAWVRFAFTAPWSVLGYLASLACCYVFWIADRKTLRWEDAGILTAEWRPWFAKVFPFSTTLGRSKIFQPGARDPGDSLDERLERHERIHVWQVEDLMFRGFLLGILAGVWTGRWDFALFLWISSGAWQLTNFVTALLRFGHNAEYPQEGKWYKKPFLFLRHLTMDIAYRDSDHERSAYAQTYQWPGGDSWFKAREIQRALSTDESIEDHERPM